MKIFKLGFRRKNDQVELNALNEELNVFKLELNGTSNFSLLADFVDIDFNSYRNNSPLTSQYKKLRAILESQLRLNNLGIVFSSTNDFFNSKIVERKIKILTLLIEENKSIKKYAQPDFVNWLKSLKNELKSLCTSDELKLLSIEVFLPYETDAHSLYDKLIRKSIKKIRKLISLISVCIKRLANFDVRDYHRKLIQFLFKNMDDESDVKIFFAERSKYYLTFINHSNEQKRNFKNFNLS